MEDHSILGNEVDRLLSLEIRHRGFTRDIIPRLQEAARRRLGSSPTLLAAQGLVDRLKRGDTVIITMGAVGPPLCPKGETDGPSGAAALGRSIDLAFGATPIYVGEDWMFDPMIAASHAAGITVRENEEEAMERPHSAIIREFPKDRDRAEAVANDFLDRYRPTALISTEKIAPNKKGVMHSALGYEINAPHAPVNVLFDEARRRELFTIGIGDNGNEIGFGLIREDVEAIHPFGTSCRCPCGAGLASASETDVLIVANVSNWGCYGLCAMLAAILEKPDLLHDAYTERRMIEESARVGAFDGSYVRQIPSVDFLPLEVHEAIITMLHSLVDCEMVTFERSGF